MGENTVIYKAGMSVNIKINKTRRNNSVDIYMGVNGLSGTLDRDYTQYDKLSNMRLCVKVEGKHNPKSKFDAFWLYPEEVEVIEDDEWINENPQLLANTEFANSLHDNMLGDMPVQVDVKLSPFTIKEDGIYIVNRDDRLLEAIKFKNGSIITSIQSDGNCPSENCSWEDVINMTKENTRKIEEGKKMELLEQIKNEAMNIVNNYKEYLTEEKK